MKRSISFLAIALVAVCLLTLSERHVFAAPPAGGAAAGTKIGYVDIEKALNDVQDGKKAKEKLKAAFDEKQKSIDKKVSTFKTNKEAFDKKAPLLKADERAKQEQGLAQQYLELQNLAAQLQQEIAQEEAKLTKPIFDRFARIIKIMGEKGSYSLILEKNQSALLYAPDSMELTSELVRNYNDGVGK